MNSNCPVLQKKSSLSRTEPPLKRRAMHAGIWTLASIGLGQSVRLASNLVLTRLLFPEAFGIMALIQVVMQGLVMFSDVGIGPSLIQNPKGESELFRKTAFTIQAGRGLILWVAACAAATPVSWWFEEPKLAWFIPVAGFVAVINGVNSTKWFLAQRRMDLRRVTILELVVQVTALIPMVVWAWSYQSVWALVFGGLVGAWFKMLLSHAVLPGSNDGFAWDDESRRALIHFGKWIFLSTVAAYFSGQVDRLILGRVMDRDMFGVYAIAVMIVSIPRMILRRLGAGVVFPAVSRRSSVPREELRVKLRDSRQPVLLGMAVGMAVLGGVGDQLVLFFWDSRYAGAAWMTGLLALGLWPTALWNSLGPALRGVGKPHYGALGDASRFFLLSAGMAFGYHMAGLYGVLIAIACADVPKYFSILIGLKRERLLSFRQDLLATAIYTTILMALLGLRHLFGMGLPMLPEMA